MQTTRRDRGKTGILLYGMYLYYRDMLRMKGYLDKRSEFNISREKHAQVINLFNKKLKDLIIYDSFIFKMPFQLGVIYIRNIKSRMRLKEDGSLDKRNLVPDWQRTKALWAKLYPGLSSAELKLIKNKKIVYNTNIHTNGCKFVVHWEKKRCNVRGHGPYEFVFARSNKRELAYALKTNPNLTYYA